MRVFLRTPSTTQVSFSFGLATRSSEWSWGGGELGGGGCKHALFVVRGASEGVVANGRLMLSPGSVEHGEKRCWAANPDNR